MLTRGAVHRLAEQEERVVDGEQAALAVGVLWVGAAEAARAARLWEVCRQQKRSSLWPEDQEV